MTGVKCQTVKQSTITLQTTTDHIPASMSEVVTRISDAANDAATSNGSGGAQEGSEKGKKPHLDVKDESTVSVPHILYPHCDAQLSAIMVRVLQPLLLPFSQLSAPAPHTCAVVVSVSPSRVPLFRSQP